MRIRTFALAARNYLILLSGLLYVCYAVPALSLDDGFVSLFTLAAQGNPLIVSALSGYLVALLLLFRKSINFVFISMVIYVISYFLMGFGVLATIPLAALQQRENFLFLALCFGAPLCNAFVYGPAISLKGEHTGHVWGLLRWINHFRGSKRFIHTVARKWGLSLREGFGKEASSAFGDIQGTSGTIREKFFDVLGYKHSYVEMTMLAHGPQIPFAILVKDPLNDFVRHPAFPDRYFKKQSNIHFKIVRFSLKWPAHAAGGITVYTEEEHWPRVQRLIAENPGLAKVLSGSLIFQNLNFPKVMVMEHARISFYAEYNVWSDLSGFSASVQHASQILDAMDRIARNNQA